MIDPETAIDYPLLENEASRQGVAFVSESGDVMPNHGEQRLIVKTPSGALKSMRNQVCPCTGPLASVAHMVDANNFVGFSPMGSFVLDLGSVEIDWPSRKDNTLEMELEVVPYAEAHALPGAQDLFKGPGFHRQL